MSEPDSPARLPAMLRELLHQPARLGLALNAALLGAWYLATYSPLHRAIAQDEHRLAVGRQRLGLAREVEHLRAQADRLREFLPEAGDGDVWVPFLMGGIRQFPIKLVSLDPRPPSKVGPYSAASYRVVVEGDFRDLERFLRWLEGSPRLVRIDAIQISSKAVSGASTDAPSTKEMQLILMGIEG